MSSVPDISTLSLSDAPSSEAVPITIPGSAAVPDDELERFRREWKEEVARRADVDRKDKEKSKSKSKEKEKDKEEGDDIDTLGEELSAVISNTSLDLTRIRSSASATSTRSKSPVKRASSPSKSPQTTTAQLPSPTATKKPLLPPRSPTKSPRATTSLLSTSPSKIPFRAPQVRKDKDGAVGVYSRAVEAEQVGRLNDALRLYRQAFKMDDNVDKLYARLMAKRAAEQEEVEEGPGVEDVVDPSAPELREFTFRRHIQVSPDHDGSTGEMSRLTSLVHASSAAASAEFLPEDEELPVPISRLPAELLDPVLAHLDVASIEAFGATCWRARRVTAYAAAWRRIAQQLYRPPMVPKSLTPRELARRHNGEWRTVVVEEERVRLDGCYISVCHYVRPGAGEEWIAVTHMITYHRFLRFYADGSVISFLTTDHPSDVVPTLNPSLRGKGLHFGRWRLIRSDAETDDEDEDGEGEGEKKEREDKTKSTAKSKVKGKGKGHQRARVLITDLVEPGMDEPKYEFEMDIALRETSRGRWNKLDLSRYSTINLRTGEVLHLSLRHQKPFYFSKVRSWQPQL